MRFLDWLGLSVVQVCPNCGEENSERASFCQACATPLEKQAAAPTRVRKTVTVVFSDVTGSTAMGERLDPELMRSMMSRYFGEMRRVLERHGGTVEKFIGDAVMAVFGIPRLHEDDAIRAVRAAAEMREAITVLNAELERTWGVSIGNRTGVNTGEVVAGDSAAGATLATGDAVNVAARLEQAAAPGEILLGDQTYKLVRHAVWAEPVEPLALKGKKEPVAAHRLVDLPGTASRDRRLVAPLVGRDDELRQLLEAFEHAVAERSCRLVTVVGGAGLGKSRLVSEAASTLEARAKVLRGRCLPYGEGITFWPVLDVFKQAAGITDADAPGEAAARLDALATELGVPSAEAERVGVLMGLTPAGGAIEESFRAVRVLLEAMSRRRPLVVVVEDIHWAEPPLLDLLAHVAELSRDAPMLLLCPARPELLETRPDWAASLANSSTLPLKPLSEEQSRQLVPAALGVGGLEEVAARIADAAGGNPLFVEEMLGMMIDDGALARDNGGWRVVKIPSSVRVPPTISALIAARLDRLPRVERAVAERASVVGKDFERQAIVALSGHEPVDGPLAELTSKEFVVAGATPDTFSFRHILIRDEAYAGIPKQLRTGLHERLADWLEEQAGARLAEYEEIVGYHLEQAVKFREKLRLSDRGIRALAHRAAHCLTSAGRRALGRGDVGAAATLLGRAVSLLPPRDRRELLPDLAHAQQGAGDLRGADATLREALRAAEAGRDEALAARAALDLSVLRLMVGSANMKECLREAERVVGVLERHGDERGLGRAWQEIGRLRVWLGNSAEAETALERAVRYARRMGEERLVSESLMWLCMAIGVGPRPTSDVIRMIEEIRRGSSALAVEAEALTELASAKAQQGRFDEAREDVEQAASLFEELGQHLLRAALHPIAEVELLAGSPKGAIERLEPGAGELRRMGERSYLSTSAAWLAQAKYELGRFEEAMDLTSESEQTAAPDDVESQIRWRGVRAKLLAQGAATEQAEALARQAVRMALNTDSPNWQGHALMELGDVLRIVGRPAEAGEAVGDALRVFHRKGNVVMAGRARTRLDELGTRGADGGRRR
jgi:class 3 adenylate cyclase/tetratricopeptide (TPR) repeat protein